MTKKKIKLSYIFILNNNTINLSMLLDFFYYNKNYLFYLSFILPSFLIYKNINKIKEINYKENKKLNKIIKYHFLFFILLLLLFFFYCDIYLKDNSIFYLRFLKLILSYFLNICSIYIIYYIQGLKSLRMFMSIFSLLILFFLSYLFFNENIKFFLFLKIKEYSFALILIVSSLMSLNYEYLGFNNLLMLKPDNEDLNKPYYLHNNSSSEDEIDENITSSSTRAPFRSWLLKSIPMKRKLSEEYIEGWDKEKKRFVSSLIVPSKEDTTSIYSNDSELSYAYWSTISSFKQRIKDCRDIIELKFNKVFKIKNIDTKDLEEVVEFLSPQTVTKLEEGVNREETHSKLCYQAKRKTLIEDREIYAKADEFRESLQKDTIKRNKFFSKLNSFISLPRTTVRSLKFYDQIKLISLSHLDKEDYEPKKNFHILGKSIFDYRFKGIKSSLDISELEQVEARRKDKPWNLRPIIDRKYITQGKMNIFEYLSQCSPEEIQSFFKDKKLKIQLLEKMKKDPIQRSYKNLDWQKGLHEDRVKEDLDKIEKEKKKWIAYNSNINNFLPRNVQ